MVAKRTKNKRGRPTNSVEESVGRKKETRTRGTHGTPPETAPATEVAVSAWDTAAFCVLVAVAVAAPFCIWRGLYDYARLPKKVLIEVGATLALCLWLTGIRQRITRPLLPVRELLPLCTFLSWSLCSLAWAADPSAGIAIWCHWASCGVVFVVMANLASGAERRRSDLCRAIFVSAVGVSLFGVVQYLLDEHFVAGRARPAATFGNKNYAATFVIMALPVGVALFLHAKRAASRWALAMGTAILLSFLFYTQARAAWLAAIAECVVFGAFVIVHPRKPTWPPPDRIRPRRAAPVLAALILTLLLTNLTPDGLSWQLGKSLADIADGVGGGLVSIGSLGRRSDDQGSPKAVEQDASNNILYDARAREEESRFLSTLQSESMDRAVFWRNTLAMAASRPLTGVGLNSFRAHYARATVTGRPDPLLKLHSGPQEAHSDPLQIVTELGLIGAGIFSWLAIAMLRRAVPPRKQTSGRGTDALDWALFLGLCGLAVNALLSFPLYREMPPFLAALFVGMVSARKRPAPPAPRSGQAWSHATGTLLVCAAWVVLLCMMAGQGCRLVADRLSLDRAKAMQHRRWDHVRVRSRAILRWDPTRSDARHARGRACLELGELPRATAALRDYRKHHGHATHNEYYLAEACRRSGELDEALGILKELRLILPGDARVASALGRTLADTGDPTNTDGAMAALETATRLHPKNASYWYDLGVFRYRNRDPNGAVVAWQEAVGVDDRNTLAHKNLGLTLFASERGRSMAIGHLKRALELDPDMDDAEQIKQTIRNYEQQENVD